MLIMAIILGVAFSGVLFYEIELLTQEVDRLKAEKNELLRKMETGFFGD